MNRQTLLVGLLAAVLVVALWWMFLFSPKQDELAEVQLEIDTALTEQAALQARIRTLQEVRNDAPQLEADLVAAETIIPREAALPSAIRMLAQAADDSGVSLVSITPGRPSQLATGPEGVAEISLAVAMDGSYFQIVDFLRRVEDPAIVPRAFLWEGMTLGIDEYPTLSGTLTGRMFAILPAVPTAVLPDADTPAPTATETPSPTPSPGGTP